MRLRIRGRSHPAAPSGFLNKNHEAAYIERAGEDAKSSGSQLTIGK